MVRIYLLLFCCFLFAGCANIVNPTGGPRDTEAPKVLFSFPKNGQKNYKGNTIILNLNEEIADNQLSNKILVSPTIDGQYTVKIKKGILKLTWADTLKENTTYTFNFVEGIKDLTEGNTVKSYSVTFSTGPDLDSNTFEASIKKQNGLASGSNQKILLFEKTDSFQKLLNKKPEYVGIIDSGKVKMTYLKEKEYTAIALEDNNKNNKWDKNEPVDIENLTIKNIAKSEFDVQPTILDSTKLISVNAQNKIINLLFSKGLQRISVKDANGQYLLTKESSRRYYIQNEHNLADSTKIQIEFVDSMGISGQYEKKVKFKNIDLQKDKDSIINIRNTNKKYLISPKLDSVQFSTDKIYKDIQPIITAPKNVSYTLTNNYNNFILKFTGQKELDSIKINIPYKSLSSVYKEYNKEFTQVLITGQEKEFGNLQFELKTLNTNYVAYLENEQHEIIYTSKNKSVNILKNLLPGAYTLYVHIDENNDGVWNAYDPINNIAAEPIYYFKEPLEIRANWDLEDIQMIF